MKPKIFFLLLLSLYIVNCTLYITNATTRFVSKTGSSTPPYTSWETAADSIQKAINICVAGDTIIVANGIYAEKVIVDRFVYLIGSSQDSTIIDGTNEPSEEVVRFNHNGVLENFTIKARGQFEPTDCVRIFFANAFIKKCKVLNGRNGFGINVSSSTIENCISIYSSRGISTQQTDTVKGLYINNVIISKNSSDNAIYHLWGSPTMLNNIVIGEGSSQTGVQFEQQKRVIFKNNLVSGFEYSNVRGYTTGIDTAILLNNNSINTEGYGLIIGGEKVIVKNSIVQNAAIGVTVSSIVSPDYNLFNKVNTPIAVTQLGEGNLFADPMFVNDTLPALNGSYNLHLQKYSPAIDAGDPIILDVDGSRSDIGIFGGPLGQKYTYMDLAPKPPRNLTGSLDSGLVHLKWNKNTEADLFRYRVYRDTVPDFIYDITKIIATVSDTFYYDDVPDKFNSGNYYYKLTAIDTAVNQSAASEEVHVSVTGIPEAPPVVVEHYRLLQNYPNPFNPTTTIPYRLKEGGYVKIMVYNLVGELVRVLVNQYQSAGYYEVEFNPNKSERKKAEGFVEFETGYYGNVASGIYLYRIEVIGEGRIPVYSDMKKMILIK